MSLNPAEKLIHFIGTEIKGKVTHAVLDGTDFPARKHLWWQGPLQALDDKKDLLLQGLDEAIKHETKKPRA